MSKTCNKCKIEKSLNSYHKDKHKKDGLYGFCKNCTKKKVNDYRISNVKLIKEKKKIHREENQEQYNKKRREKYLKNRDKERTQQKIYFNNNKHIWNIYSKNQYRNNPIFKLKLILRNRINKIINSNLKSGSVIEDLGCTIEQLRKHLEKQFKSGMTWENHSQFGWHIDHIKPLASFDLTNREEFLQACHFTNLQPLWWDENLSKSSRVTYNS